MSKRNYQVSSTIAKPEIYQHSDNLLYNVLFRRVLRLNRVLESWNFGLYFVDSDGKFWLDLDKDTYSTIGPLPTNDAGEVPLTLDVFTYPLNINYEVWSQSAVSLFFYDAYKIKDRPNVLVLKNPELLALEDLISEKRDMGTLVIQKKAIVNEQKDNERKMKVDEYRGYTQWQLMRKYLDIMQEGQFERITGEFKCDKGETHIAMSKSGIVITVNAKKNKYEWHQIQNQKTKGSYCDLRIQNEGTKYIMHLIFDSKTLSKQFSFVIYKHLCQFNISNEAKNDAEFVILKHLTEAEQKWIEKAETLQAELSNFNKKTESMENENICLKKLTKDLQQDNKNLEKSIKKETDEKMELEKKIQIYQMNTSKTLDKDKEIKDLKKEIENVKTGKAMEIDKLNRQIKTMNKTIDSLEERIKVLSNSQKLKMPQLFSSPITETDLEFVEKTESPPIKAARHQSMQLSKTSDKN